MTGRPDRRAKGAATAWWWQLPRSTRRGVVAGLVFYVSIASVGLVAMPWKGTADSLAHLDYVYQVTQGQLPEPYGSLFTFPGSESPILPDGARQFASAHPPLYYALVALVTGTLLDSGQWEATVAIGRVLNLTFGAVTFLVLAWFGWSFGGRYRRLTAIAVPMAGALAEPFLRFSGDIYNDVLVTMLSALALAGAALVLRDGVTRSRLVFLTVVSAAGMAAKATFVVTLVVVGLAVVLGEMLHGTGPKIRRFTRGLVRALPLGVAPALAIGWFYARNLALSGSPVRSTGKSALPGRPERGILDNLTNPDFYLVLPRGLLGQSPLPPGQQLNHVMSFAIFVVCVGSIAAALWVHRRSRPSPSAAAIVALLVVHLLGFQVAQLYHSTGFGNYNARYFLPTILQLGVLLAAGAVLRGRRGALAVPVLGLVQASWFVVGTAYYIDRRYPAVGGGSLPSTLADSAAANGFPAWLPLALVLVGGLGLLVAGVQAGASGAQLGTPESRPANPDDLAGSPARPSKAR